MSHFSVMVVTDTEPTEDTLAAVMQPYHEFECTGDDDQYVQDVDDTAELRQQYETYERMMIRTESGELVPAVEDRFYRDPTEEEQKRIGPIAGTGCGHGMSWHSQDWGDGSGYRTKVRYVPSGCEQVDVPATEVMSFREFIDYSVGRAELHTGDLRTDDHKYGFVEIGPNGEVIRAVDRTNPNARWDSWRIGGRYRSKLKAKNTVAATSSDPSWEWKHDDIQSPDGYDIAQVRNLDLDEMKRLNVTGRREWAKQCAEKAKMTISELEAAIRQDRVCHAEWLKLDEPKPRGGEFDTWAKSHGYYKAVQARKPNWDLPKIGDSSIEEWIDAAPLLCCFAVVMGGKWYEKGKMGWWACVTNELDCWEEKFDGLFRSLNPDQWIAILDCHI